MKQIKNKPCTCGICKKIIFTKVDNYCHLIDYKEGNFFMEGYYHTKCYNDNLKGSTEMNLMKKKAMNLLNAAGKMIGMEEEKDKEVVWIN